MLVELNRYSGFVFTDLPEPHVRACRGRGLSTICLPWKQHQPLRRLFYIGCAAGLQSLPSNQNDVYIALFFLHVLSMYSSTRLSFLLSLTFIGCGPLLYFTFLPEPTPLFFYIQVHMVHFSFFSSIRHFPSYISALVTRAPVPAFGGRRESYLARGMWVETQTPNNSKFFKFGENPQKPYVCTIQHQCTIM